MATFYLAVMLCGSFGFLIMAMMGAAHGGHSGHAGLHNGSPHGVVHGHVSAHSHVHAHSGSRGDLDGKESGTNSSPAAITPIGDSKTFNAIEIVTSLFSPMRIFSFMVGAGGVGLSVPFHGAVQAVGAVVGGVLFDRLLVTPFWNLLMKFASPPSENLNGAVATEVKLVSRFDDHRRAVVELVVDGQISRVLAELDENEKSSASEFNPGDMLMVTSVDGKSNTCKVMRFD